MFTRLEVEMDTMRKAEILSKDPKGERGAALVMALMISFLLLAGVAGVILE